VHNTVHSLSGELWISSYVLMQIFGCLPPQKVKGHCLITEYKYS